MSARKSEPEGRIARRTFLRGIGLAATATALDATSTLLTAGRTATAASLPETTGVASAPLVMIWRQVSDLNRCTTFVTGTTAFPVVDRQTHAVIYDGGSVLLGFGVAHPEATHVLVHPRPRILNEPCRFQPNPASTIVHIPVAACSQTLPFMDQDGHHSSFAAPSGHDRTHTGRRLQQIADRCAAANDAMDTQMPRVETPVGALELLVSDLPRATAFYRDALGLRLLSNSTRESQFDLGTIVLTLRPEPTGMMVQFLHKTGRLRGDWAVLQTPDVDAAVARLRGAGVRFPSGIERQAIGRVAYLSDPDGHSWVLWEPSARAREVAYYPPLTRMLANAGMERAPFM